MRRYDIGFAATNNERDGSIKITDVHVLPAMGLETYLHFTSQLTYFDHHRPNVTQCTNEKGIYFLFPLPPLTDLETIRSIADGIADDDPVKDLVNAFGNNLQDLSDPSSNLRLYVRIYFAKAA